jgi:hypothetical protein
MDLATLEKKAIFIPTPGQFEQVYLAKKLNEEGIIPMLCQDEFTLKDIEFNNEYSGFKGFDYHVDYDDLFSLFERKREFAPYS